MYQMSMVTLSKADDDPPTSGQYSLDAPVKGSRRFSARRACADPIVEGAENQIIALLMRWVS
jgi:hypothetical protein